VSYPCPFCRTPADLTGGCPGCGRGPDADAALVIRLDAEIAALHDRLRDLGDRRNAAAARVRSAVAAAAAPPSAPPGAVPASPPGAIPAPLSAAVPTPSPAAPPSAPLGAVPAPSPASAALPSPAVAGGPETSTRLVQTVLFVLGGLLLGVAAVVFTAVAWAQFGVQGRAVVLAGFTGAALAAPLLALRRGLTATAETFAAVGLLLVLLDGYAAWYVDLFGVAGFSAYGYAGAVCAVTAAVAAGYEHVTGLTGPRYAALVVAQPVLPLVVAPLEPDATGWAYTLAAVALLNLMVIALRRGTLTGVGITAYLLGLFSVVGSGISALAGLGVAVTAGPTALAGTGLVTGALVVLAGAVLARIRLVQQVAGGLLVVAAGVAAGRFVTVVSEWRFLVAAVAAVLALAVAMLPAGVRRGPWVGALLVIAWPALAAVAEVAEAALGTVNAAHLVGLAAVPLDWQLPAAVVLLTAGLTALAPAGLRSTVLIGGAGLVALAAPVGFDLPWWSAPVVNLLVAAAAMAVAVRRRVMSGSLVAIGVVALVLVAHAVLVGYGRPGVAAATLGAVLALGVATAVAARTTPRRSDVGGAALAIGLLAAPAMAWSAAAALPAVWPPRAALAAAALVVVAAHLAGRYRPFARVAARLALVTAPLWPLGATDSPAVYAAAGLVLVATTAVGGRAGLLVAAVPLVAGLVVGAGDSLASVLVRPYLWTGDRPAGAVDPGDVVALVLAAGAAAVAVRLLQGRLRAALWAAAPVVAPAVPMAVAAAGTPWPGTPFAALLAGLAGLLAVAVWPPYTSGTGRLGAAGAGPVLAVVSVVVGAGLAGAGLAGALPARWSTLVATGAIVVAGAVAGTAARDLPARLIGWVGAVAAALGFAFTAGRAAGLALPAAALPVLAASALVLAAGALLPAFTGRASGTGRADGGRADGGRADRGRAEAGRSDKGWAGVGRAVEGRAIEAAAHAGAVLALLLTAGSPRYAAVVCTLWGVALGVRALRPVERRAVRHGLVVAAAAAEAGAWWLLLAAERVSLPEAYTLPAAAVALLAGRLALRSVPGLSSWIAYGPALAAALLPSLASVLVEDGQPVRRLVLGLGALAVVVAGTHRRRQAPVMIGGGVLSVVALHEVVLVWDLLPRWIPLAAVGLLLVGLAMTLERRRRDLARMRSALTRMS
jgi:hypothetical protein